MIGFAITRGYTVVVDDIDADLAKLRWYAKFSRNDHYRGAARSIRLPTGQQTVCRLHRVIAERMGLAIEGRHVDHEDLNPSNNRRSNLRTATNGESNRNRGMRRDNSSGFAGVDSQGSKHRASIVFEKQRIHLGLFVYPQHASDIRSLAAAILFQEFANLPEPINSQIDVLRGLQRPDLTTKQSRTEFRRWLNRFYAIMHSDPSIWPVETESPPEPDDYN